MKRRFLVWRLEHGIGDATEYEAIDHEDAAGDAHGSDFESGDDVIFCVQEIGGRDRKVHVLSSNREMVPQFTSTRLTQEKLKARCACGRRLFDDDSVGRQCRRCWFKSQAAIVAKEATTP